MCNECSLSGNGLNLYSICNIRDGSNLYSFFKGKIVSRHVCIGNLYLGMNVQ